MNDIPIVIWSKYCSVSSSYDRLVACLFIWRCTINPRLVKNWCTCNTGTWYAANFTYAMTYFLIKTQMIMFTQPPCAMKLWMWNTKFYFWELVCITIHFHLFLCNISIILNMILSVCPFSFTVSFSLFLLMKDSMFTMLFRHIFCNSLARLKKIFCVIECIRIYELNVFDTDSWTLDINWYKYKFSMGLRPSTISLPFSGACIPQSIITE